MISPSLTTTAPNGPPHPFSTDSMASRVASSANRVLSIPDLSFRWGLKVAPNVKVPPALARLPVRPNVVPPPADFSRAARKTTPIISSTNPQRPLGTVPHLSRTGAAHRNRVQILDRRDRGNS